MCKCSCSMLCHRTIRSQAADHVWHARFAYRNDDPLVMPLDTTLRQKAYPLYRQCFFRSFVSHPRSPWTHEEDQELVALRKRGVKWSQMKFYLEGRSTHAIMTHFQKMCYGDGPLAKEARDLTRLRRKGVPLVIEDVQMAVQLRAEGLTAREIDERIGKGHGILRIGEFIRNPDQFLNPQKETRFTPEEDLLLVQLVSKKLRWSEIAKHFPSKAVRTLQLRWFILHPKESSFESRDRKVETKVFTLGETEKLLNMYKQGLTSKAIAETLGCTSDQVSRKLYSHGLVSTYVDIEGANKVLLSLKTQGLNAPQQVTVDQANQIREMSRSGMSVTQIALALNRHRKTVGYWLRLRNDDSPRPNAWSVEQEAKLQKLYHDGKDADQIAKDLGRSRSSIEARLHIMRTRKAGESPVSHKLPWAPQEESRLAEMYMEGKATSVISDQLGRMPAGVEGKIVQMRKSGRIPPKRPNVSTPADTSTAGEV